MNKNGYSPMPNVVIDELLRLLTGAEYKVLSIIARQTLGWHTYWDRISVSQFRKIAGLSKSGVLDALNVLVNSKLVLRERVNNKGKLPEVYYALYGDTTKSHKLVCSPDQYDNHTSTIIILELVRSVDQLGGKLVRSSYPQKKGSKERKKNNNSPRERPRTRVSKDLATLDEEVVVFDNSQGKGMSKNTQDIDTFQKAFPTKWPNQLTTGPGDGKCRQVLDKFEWNLFKLLDAINRAPVVLTPKDKSRAVDTDYALSVVISYAQHPTWGVRSETTPQEKQGKVRQSLSNEREWYKQLEEQLKESDTAEKRTEISTLMSESHEKIRQYEDSLGRG